MGDEEELGISQSKGEQAHPLAEKDAPRGRSHRHSSRVRPGERLGADKAAPVSRQSPSNTTGMCREPGPQQGLRRSRGADSKHGELCVGKQGRGSDRNTEDFFFWLSLSTACRIPVPQPGIEPVPSAVKARCPNHWTARGLPNTEEVLMPTEKNQMRKDWKVK